jgi:hypothetical protein
MSGLLNGATRVGHGQHLRIAEFRGKRSVVKGFALDDCSCRLVGLLLSPLASGNKTLLIVLLVSRTGTPVRPSSTRLRPARPHCHRIQAEPVLVEGQSSDVPFRVLFSLRTPPVFAAMSNISQVIVTEIKDKENSGTAAKPPQCGRRVAIDL